MAVYKIERCPTCRYKHHEPKPGKVNKACPKCGTVMKYSTNWYFSHQVHGRKMPKAVSPRKDITSDALAKEKVELREGRFFDRVPQTSWDEAVTEFKKHGMIDLKQDTKDMYINSLDALTEYFKLYTLDRIRIKDVDEYMSHRLTEGARWKMKQRKGTAISKTTVNRDIVTLKRLLNLSIEWDLLMPTKHVLKILKKKRFKETPRIRFLTAEEIDRLLWVCRCPLSPRASAHLYLAVLIALNTGLRKEGVFCMLRSAIDLPSGIIRRVVKNDKEVVIPLTGRLIDGYQWYKSKLPIISPYVFPSMRHGVILNTKKSMRRDANIGFRNACRDADITNFRYHDLRHTFASWFLMKTRDIVALQEILGHSNISTTRKYIHVLQEHLKESMKEFETSQQ
jgi:integrase/recombinase XerD